MSTTNSGANSFITKNRKKYKFFFPIGSFLLVINLLVGCELFIGVKVPVNSKAPTIEVSGPVLINTILKANNGVWTGNPSFTYQWNRIDAKNISVAIEGATKSSYTLVDEDAEHMISVTIMGKNSAGSSLATSSSVGPVKIGPKIITAPQITFFGVGYTVGSVLMVSDGVWGPQADPPSVVAYSWMRDTVPISNATTNQYTLVSEDAGKAIKALVTARNSAGDAQAEAPATGRITMAPINTTLPSISGTDYSVGTVLTANPGIWEAYPTPVFSFEWIRSGTTVGTSSTYTLVPADAGNSLKVKVTATSSEGNWIKTAIAYSDPTGSVGLPLSSASIPVLSGTATVGQTLTGTSGTWNGYPAPTFSYQWYRKVGTTATKISTATSSQYTLTDVDVGYRLALEVTATNTSTPGGARATSLDSDLIIGIDPANTVLPSISGTLQVGQVLTATSGSWTGRPAPSNFIYQWKREGVNINNATANTYTLAVDDAGKTLTITVSVRNSQGFWQSANVEANSLPTTTIGQAIANTVAPTIPGYSAVDQVLSGNAGTWVGVPTPTLSYQWYRETGLTYNSIPNATQLTYTPTDADIGSYLFLRVKGTNANNSVGVFADSNTAGIVVGINPANTVLPSISGTLQVGQVLTATSGSWTGRPAPSNFIYQWKREGVNINNATASTYTLAVDDAGKTLTITVSVRNSQGSWQSANIEASSLPTTTIGQAIANTVAPTAPSYAAVDQVLSGNAGTWVGVPTPTLSYQWYRKTGTSTSLITNATQLTYTPTDADIGSYLFLRVKGTNVNNSVGVSVDSNTTGIVVGINPANTVLPSISGTQRVGQVLTANPGTWTGKPAPAFSYQWYRGTSTFTGGTSSTYTLVTDDVGQTIKVIVTGSNSKEAWTGGTSTASSASTGVIAGIAPTNTGLPTITGGANVGSTLTGSDGTWSGSPAPTFSYKWFRNTVEIQGATTTTYTTTIDDIAGNLQFEVTATNSVGSASAKSVVFVVSDAVPTPYIQHVTSTGTFDVTLPLGTVAKDVYFIFTNKDSTAATGGPTVIAKSSMPGSNTVLSVNGTVLAKPKPMYNVSGSTTLEEKIRQFNSRPPRPSSLLSARTAITKSDIAGVDAKDDAKGNTSTFHVQRSGNPDVTVTDLPATNAYVAKNIDVGGGRSRSLSIWVETVKYGNTITDAMVQDIADRFLSSAGASDIYRWATAAAGEPWGGVDNGNDFYVIPWDQNNTITILLADLNVNYNAGVTVGYFWGKDNIKAEFDDKSNQRIMFYIDSTLYAARSGGENAYSPNNYWPKVIASTLAHEFQHMIQFYQKPILRNVGSAVWQNELSSMILEDLLSDKMNVPGPRGVAGGTAGPGNPLNTDGRIPSFNNNLSTGIYAEGGFSLLQYSISYSFGAWLARNYGGATLLQRIVQDSGEGSDAVVSAVRAFTKGGETFDLLLSKWAVAVLGSSRQDMPDGYKFNVGTWFDSQVNNVNYNLGSINFFNYAPVPQFLTIQANTTAAIPTGANMYFRAASQQTGKKTWTITLPNNIGMAVFVKN